MRNEHTRFAQGFPILQRGPFSSLPEGVPKALPSHMSWRPANQMPRVEPWVQEKGVLE